MLSQPEGKDKQADSCEQRACFLKSILLRNILRSGGWERLYGHNMVDDLMVPANCGKEGVVKWRPRSISHEVSVSSTSKHLRKA